MSYSANGNTVYYYGNSALKSLTDLRFKKDDAQVYADIFKNAMTSGAPFEDPEFPHGDSSVGDYDVLFDVADLTMKKKIKEWKEDGWTGSATWYRVADLCTILYQQSKTACFNCGDIGKTIARNDIRQGFTGDCWFLSSISDVSMIPALIENVVPMENTTNSGGVYHFRFWYQGAWVDVVVDDYLPCVVTKDKTFTLGTNFFPIEGENGKTGIAEFWPMMLEKAFAKLNGGYSNIASNWIVVGQEALTGGFGDFIKTKKAPSDAYDQILKWFDRACVVGAGTEKGGDGIVGSHAYSVTAAHVITTDDGNKHNLLRCRNPWGHHEWKGKWSYDSDAWDNVSDAVKKEIGLQNKHDGEFWISFDDVLKYYSDLDACFYYDSSAVSQSNSKYQFAQFNTSWSRGSNTAGGFNRPWQNPLFEVEVATSNATGFLVAGCSVQINISANFNAGDRIRLFPTGGATNFNESFFKSNSAKEIFPAGKPRAPKNFNNSYNQFYNLAPGKYVIVPCSLHSGVENNILVRVFNEGTAPATQAPTPTGSGSQSGSGSSSSSSSSSSSDSDN